MKRIITVVLPLLCLTMALSGYAAANAITYTGTNGSLAASATFNLTGSTLTVTLANTSTGDAKNDTALLLAVLFNTSTTLTPISASLPSGTTVYGSFVNNVGEGWQYKSGINAHGENSGISAAGYGVFGPKGNFYSPGKLLQGSDYGIAPLGFTNTGNPSIKDPIVENSVVFTLNAPGFSLSDLGNTVVFQYATSLSDGPSIDGHIPTPEPSTLLMLGSGMIGLAGVIRRKRT